MFFALSRRLLHFCFVFSLLFVSAINADASDLDRELYQRLCELNQGWTQRTPDFNALPKNWTIQSDIGLIQTHLRLVIAQLEQANVSHLTDAQLSQRQDHINTLQIYLDGGVFPQNVFVPGRRPVFIDPWGTHCAVGHLIATSGHPELAHAINREHQLDFLRDISTAGLSEWQVESGLSMDELALIQPTYVSYELEYPKEIEDLILGDSAAITKAVKEEPSLVNSRCGGKTLLHYAAAAGDLELAKFLVEKGADLNAVSQSAQQQNPTKQEKPERPRIGVRNSSTLHKVRWNQPTLVSPSRGGGLRMGTYGRVFSTKSGRAIANLLNDIRGGIADKNALYFAIKDAQPRYGFGKPLVNEELDKLNKDRAAVATWLREQGLK